MEILLTGLMAYFVSLVILLLVFYFHERAKVGPVTRHVLRIMTQMSALFALVPATAYVLITELLRRPS